LGPSAATTTEPIGHKSIHTNDLPPNTVGPIVEIVIVFPPTLLAEHHRD